MTEPGSPLTALDAVMSSPSNGKPLQIGRRFFAYSFRPETFGSEMGPVLMVDHFWMSDDTFGLHPHSGISAVTYVFEDSRSPHMNQDSLGNDLPIEPGDVHWMVAGKGVAHNEKPGGENPLVHALQIFVMLPHQQRDCEPYAVHLDAADVPELIAPGVRVRVMAGELRGHASPLRLPQPFSFFDCQLEAGASTQLPLPFGWGGWLGLINGSASIEIDGAQLHLTTGQAVALKSRPMETPVRIVAGSNTQIVMMAGSPG